MTAVTAKMTDQQAAAIGPVFAVVDGGLLGVCVALIALAPPIVDIARDRRPGFWSGRAAQRRLAASLRVLRYVVWMFVTAIVLAELTTFTDSVVLGVGAGLLSTAALALVAGASAALAGVAKSMIEVARDS